MNCLEFKKALVEEQDTTQEIEFHLESCQECSRWLDKANASAPEGFLPAQLDRVSTSLLEPLLPTTPPPLLEKFFKSLFPKFALAGALAGAIAVSIVAFRPSLEVRPLDENKSISFIDPDEESVTTDELLNSNDWSFLDKQDSEFTFLDEEKEEPWLEKSVG